MKHKITEKLLEEAYELYKQGVTYRELGKRFNIYHSYLAQKLREKYNFEAEDRSKHMHQDIFEELWNQGLSDEEIAEKMGVALNTVKSFRTRGENAGKFTRNNYFSESGIKLTHEQEQFILGSLLGDLNLAKPKYNQPNSRLAIVHSKNQTELFMKKVELLGDFMASYKETSYTDKRTNNTYYTIRGNSKAHPVFTEMYNLLYPNGIKTITLDFLNKIDSPIALAYWFMDDGTVRGTFATNCFRETEVKILIDWLKTKWGIICTKQKQKKQYTIYITAQSRLAFEQLIFPYMIPSMYYKLKYLDLLT